MDSQENIGACLVPGANLGNRVTEGSCATKDPECMSIRRTEGATVQKIDEPDLDAFRQLKSQAEEEEEQEEMTGPDFDNFLETETDLLLDDIPVDVEALPEGFNFQSVEQGLGIENLFSIHQFAPKIKPGGASKAKKAQRKNERQARRKNRH